MREIVLHPNHCDAWEIANTGNEPYMDLAAYEYAAAHDMVMTCGSDIHSVDWLKEDLVFAMETDEPLNSEQDYVRLILSGKGFRTVFPKDRLNCEHVDPELPVYWRY